MNYVDSFNLFGVNAKEIPCIKGSGEPIITAAVGCFYMDTDTGTVYKCTAVGVWEEMGSTEEKIADYLSGEIESVSESLKAVQDANPKSATFAFIADLHFHYNSEHLVRHNLRAIDEIAKHIKNEFCAFGGDNLAEAGTAEQHLTKMRYFGEILRDYKTCSLLVKGNHDDNSLAGYDADTDGYSAQYAVADKDYYAKCFRHNENVQNVMMDQNRDRLFYYVDLPSQQIRIIFLNCVDIPILDDGSGNLVYEGIHQYGYSNEQLNWVIKDALNFEDKKSPEQWGVITVQHITDCDSISSFSNDDIVQADHNGGVMCKIFEAFQSKTSYASSCDGDFAHDVSCDFTNAKQDLICRISGHTHKDWNVMHNNILYISTMAAGVESVGNNTAIDGNLYEKTENTAEESAFDFFTIDKDSKTVYATRFGAGVNREFSYAVEDDENAIEDDGNLFTYGTSGEYADDNQSSDYEYHTGGAFIVTVNAEGKYLEANDTGGNSKVLFRTTQFENDGGVYNLSAVFTSLDDEYTATPRFLVRCYDTDGNRIAQAPDGFTYNTYYVASFKDADQVSFTLPSGTVTFQVGFMFSVGVNGEWVRISDILLTNGAE